MPRTHLPADVPTAPEPTARREALPRRGTPVRMRTTHPLMFSDDDPYLARVRELALGLPGAAEKTPHGHPAFFTVKVFANYGGSVKVDGSYVQHEHSLVLQADLAGREALRQRPDAYLPAYLAPTGWTGLDLCDATDWAEVAELIEDSYRATASQRFVASLDN